MLPGVQGLRRPSSEKVSTKEQSQNMLETKATDLLYLLGQTLTFNAGIRKSKLNIKINVKAFPIKGTFFKLIFTKIQLKPGHCSWVKQF